jgi:hypothetical protein
LRGHCAAEVILEVIEVYDANGDAGRGFCQLCNSAGNRDCCSRYDGAACVQGAQPNHSKTGPDISRADRFFALLSAQRGHSIEEIAARLMEQTEKAKENGERYAQLAAKSGKRMFWGGERGCL